MADERITAEYLVETPLAVDSAAESMAGEQSTGTFTRVPGETDALRERFAARVESIEELEPCASPSIRLASVGPRFPPLAGEIFSWPTVWRRWHAPPYRSLRPPDHWHDREAECRPDASRDR